ncbi:methyltransferase domain-containing protein [Roseibium salinum]|nr:methyltransferase domain-containing protein [Roseibium salinum]
MNTIVTDNPAATMWGSTGKAYDGISFGLSDTISHAVQMLWPRPGERILDIGTGTGWAARLAAGRGASVTGIDIAPRHDCGGKGPYAASGPAPAVSAGPCRSPAL